MSPENEALLRTLKRAGLIAVGLLAAILLIGGVTRYVQASNLQSWTAASDIPTVALIAPTASGDGQALTLPGTLEAYYDAKIYSRVPGYAWVKLNLDLQSLSTQPRFIALLHRNLKGLPPN